MQFTLPPWDRNRPRIHPPMADSVVSAHGKTFGLRAQNGLLFFRDQSDPTKIWIIGTPLSSELEADVAEREAFFAREFERGNIARYVLHLDSYLERTVPLFFRGNGTGWCRESWNRDDLPFTHSVSMHVLLEGADEAIDSEIADVEEQLERQLSQLPFPDDAEYHVQIDWLCGSQTELEKLAHWICAVETPLWREGVETVALEISCENSFARAYVRGVDLKGATYSVNAPHMWLTTDERDQLRVWSGESLPLSRRFWSLFDLALDQNTPAGLHWEYRDYGQNRTADEPQSPEIELSVTRPTQHELLEAHRNLQQWLASFLPELEAKRLLDDETSVLLPQKEW